jgi:antitoxin component YwqK of YwqJK toxin-antitoxin module
MIRDIVDGKAHGEMYSFYEPPIETPGLTIRESTYSQWKNGKRDGVSYYRKSDKGYKGRIAHTCNYHNNTQHGLAIDFDANGIPTKIVEYNNGNFVRDVYEAQPHGASA